MKIVVAGASGFIGSKLVPVLQGAGHDVVRLVRREVAAADEVRWDPAAGSLDAELVAGAGAFVNLAGATIAKRWTRARKQEILDSRVQTTSLLAATAARLEPMPALVCASAIGFYGDRGDELLTEESGRGEGFLAGIVEAWEAAAEAARAAGARVVHLRTGPIVHGDGGLLPPMLRPFKLGLGGRVGSGRQWWSWVALADVLAAYAQAADSELSGVYNLVSPNPARNSEFVDALGRALRRPTIFPLPAAAVKAIFGEMGGEVLLGGQRVRPARLEAAGFTFAEPDLEQAIRRALAA